MTTTTLLALGEVWRVFDSHQISPEGLHVEGSLIAYPIIDVRFESRADLDAFAAADKATKHVEHNHTKNRGYDKVSARYERPGRRMRLRHFCFPHCDDYQDGAS
ncbi:hypothetical protein [Nakamurella aerolata]|uniref:Uncharacterized protein n=1 Tax=Nakamurella aerolata TaxID=1656892 RepID=A0A849AB80_9ACTN|nr:hypothetical protein [Nakamurella aerolata]NNG36923.1 hypothetical protein [Nakamurella aerolata]